MEQSAKRTARHRWLVVALLLGCEGTMTATGPDATPVLDAPPAPDGSMSTDGGVADRVMRDAADGTDSSVIVPPPLDECASAPAEWIFCDSFESGVTYDGTTREPVLVDEPGPFGHTGNHAAQLRVPPGSGGSSVYKDLSPELDVAYVRFYVMWEPGHDFTAPRHGPGGLHGGNTDCVGCSGSRPSDWFTATLETVTRSPFTIQSYTYYPGMYMDCANPSGSCWGDMFPCTAGPSYCTRTEHAARGDEPVIEAGRWYCLEQMIDAGTPTDSIDGADGVLDFWIDGHEIGPWTGLWFRSRSETRIDALWLYLYHHAEHSPEGLLLDHVVVSRSRVGCSG